MVMQRVVRFTEVNKVVVEKRDIGEPKNDRVRVKSIASVISPGTELAVLTGKHAAYKDMSLGWGRVPMDGGYCWAGEVTDPGKFTAEFPKGTCVVLPLAHADVHDFDPANTQVIKLSGKKMAELGGFIPLNVIGASAVFAAPPSGDSTIAVIGLGLIGQMCLQVYAKGLLIKQLPARSVGFDLTPDRVSKAQSCGCESVTADAASSWGETFKKTFGDKGPSIIVEATGSAKVAAALMEGAPDFSTLVLLGSTREPVSIDLYKWIHRKALTIVGAHGKIMTRDGGIQKDKLEKRLFGDIKKGKLVVEPLITDKLSLDEAAEGYRRLIEEPASHVAVLLYP